MQREVDVAVTIVLLVGVVVAIALGGLLVCIGFDQPRPFKDLKQDGNRMIAAVEEYRQRHGRYPNTLADAGVVPPETRHGPWEYESDGTSFVLSVGNYLRDGFVLYYSSRNRTWYSDT